MGFQPMKIDKVLRALTTTMDQHLNEEKCLSTGAKMEVGYFELRRLVEYVTTQRNNLALLERLVADARNLSEG